MRNWAMHGMAWHAWMSTCTQHTYIHVHTNTRTNARTNARTNVKYAQTLPKTFEYLESGKLVVADHGRIGK